MRLLGLLVGRWSTGALNVLLVVALVGAVNLLPPDTSLSRVRDRGALRVCVPDEYPPLVTQDPSSPGIDLEILQEVSDDIGVDLQRRTNAQIGRDFNPRNWRVTRAQCEVLAGGVVVAGVTRSFLETTPPHLETGWAVVIPPPSAEGSLRNSEVGIVTSAAGLDRIALSRYLRSISAEAMILPGADEGRRALEEGRIPFLITEALLARRLAQAVDGEAAYIGEPLQRWPLGFGLWKGDLTLKRAIVASLRELEGKGVITRIIERYELSPIVESCPVCP